MLFMSYSLIYPGAVRIKHWDFASSRTGRAQHVWESNSLAKYMLGSYLGQKKYFFFTVGRGTFIFFIRKRGSCIWSPLEP